MQLQFPIQSVNQLATKFDQKLVVTNSGFLSSEPLREPSILLSSQTPCHSHFFHAPKIAAERSSDEGIKQLTTF